MEKYLYNSGIKKIEYYLKRYNLLDLKISRLSELTDEYDYRQTYNKWLKNKCSSLEEDAIRNIELEQRIYKVRKWQNLITAILEYYKTKDKIKYKFICLKYFKKLTPIKIQERMNLTEEEQDGLRFEILNYIFAVAIKKNMLKEVEV
ncbi:MAG: hypothetical protein HFJ33_04875 [Clostridia bacterium]|nr:hypothetical protein [Clostridia bacterium]